MIVKFESRGIRKRNHYLMKKGPKQASLDAENNKSVIQ